MIYYFYKIVCDDLPDYLYVGSTRAFTNRKYQHKTNCNNVNSEKYNLKIYQTIRANGGWDNWKMICIHQQDIENRRMAEKIEENYRLDLKANMNANRAYRSEEDKKEHYKEYRENNKEHIKQYYENNKEQLTEYKKEWYVDNKERILEKRKEYHENNSDYIKERAKEYYENNKEHIKERSKNYHENNKEKIKEQYSKKIICVCGCQIRRNGLAEHKRTQKHIKLMENI